MNIRLESIGISLEPASVSQGMHRKWKEMKWGQRAKA